MLFSVPKLKSISNKVQELDTKERKTVSTMLHRRQPEFCEIIDWVGMDPRCAKAHSFCLVFCGIALMEADEATGCKLLEYSGQAIKEISGYIARGEEAQVGRWGCGFRRRIANHVLRHSNLDNDDMDWLCTTISGFLFTIERSIKKKNIDHPTRLLKRSSKTARLQKKQR